MITATIPVQMATIETGTSTRQQNTMTTARPGLVAQRLRVVVAVGLTALLLWQSDPGAVWRAARDADWRFILLACALVVSIASSWRTAGGRCSRRWISDLMADPSGRRVAVPSCGCFFVSTFVGTFLPASVGGDAVRAYGLSQEGVGGVDAVASVLMDRLLGVVSILIVALAGALLARDLIDIRALLPALALLTLLCAGALAVVFSPRAAAGIARAWLCCLVDGKPARGSSPPSSDTPLPSAHGERAGVLDCRPGAASAADLLPWPGTGAAVPLGVYFALVPIILLIVLMPITINGIGTTQAGFVWLFGRAGVASAPAFALVGAVSRNCGCGESAGGGAVFVGGSEKCETGIVRSRS